MFLLDAFVIKYTRPFSPDSKQLKLKKVSSFTKFRFKSLRFGMGNDIFKEAVSAHASPTASISLSLFSQTACLGSRPERNSVS